jgi:hypothetical protein
MLEESGEERPSGGMKKRWGGEVRVRSVLMLEAIDMGVEAGGQKEVLREGLSDGPMYGDSVTSKDA